jgi:hypothetical protein
MNVLPPSSLEIETVDYLKMHAMVLSAMRTLGISEPADRFFAELN